MNLELNPTGNRHVDENLEPYRELANLLSDVGEMLDVYVDKYIMELKNDVDLRTPYQDLVDALGTAKDNMPNLDKLAEQIAENLMEEKQFTQRDIG